MKMELENFENEDQFDYNIPPRYIEKNTTDFLEESIDDFLRRPIDSRNLKEEEPEIFENSDNLDQIPQKVKPVLITVKPTNMNTVLFDWNSTIKRLSNKLKPEKNRPKSRGLPDIARREIQKEKEEIRRRNTIERVPIVHEKKVMYPLRKNELPLLRKVPTVLTETKRRRTFR